MYHHCEELRRALKTKKPGDNQKAKAWWAIFKKRTRVGLWEAHAKKVQRLLWRRRWNVWNGIRVNLLQQVNGDQNFGSRVFAVFARPRPDGSQQGDHEESAESFGKGPVVKECGLLWIRGMSWECARQPAAGTRQVIKKEPSILREVMDFGHGAPLEAGEYEEHHVENLSLEVVGQGWSGWLVHLFLEDWELARVAVSCHLALDLFCQVAQDAW